MPSKSLGPRESVMARRGTGDWSMSSDPCPRCGSTQTIVSDVYMLRQHGKIYGAAVPLGRRKVFGMYCYGCGNRERKQGIPGRETSRVEHAQPSHEAKPARREKWKQ
jgi:hypothetical protein